MQYRFSDRVQALKPSAIREIFKYASRPGMISLSAGNPAPEAFPVKEIAEISEKILRERPVDALQYSVTEGYPRCASTWPLTCVGSTASGAASTACSSRAARSR